MIINNINNTNAWCQLVYKSLIFYYKNYKQLNQKLSKISLLHLIHCGTVVSSSIHHIHLFSLSRPRTCADEYMKSAGYAGYYLLFQ